MTALARDPIVVLGAPRSGTTYLRQILTQHPEVAITNEFRVFDWLHRAIDLCEDDRAVLERRAEFQGQLRRDLPELIRDHYRQLAPNARWWGDKNPHYAENPAVLQTIRTLFPAARFVHIVRDPRAVLASLLRKRHADGSVWVHPEEAHVLVATHLQNADTFLATCGADCGRELRYEELVAGDVTVARELFAWLEIPFAPEVEQFCRGQQQGRTSFSGPTSDLAAAGSRDAARQAWACALPASARRDSLQFLAPLLLRFGYETEASLDALNRALPGDS